MIIKIFFGLEELNNIDVLLITKTELTVTVYGFSGIQVEDEGKLIVNADERFVKVSRVKYFDLLKQSKTEITFVYKKDQK